MMVTSVTTTKEDTITMAGGTEEGVAASTTATTIGIIETAITAPAPGLRGALGEAATVVIGAGIVTATTIPTTGMTPGC
jgi:hypothetical protein